MSDDDLKKMRACWAWFGNQMAKCENCEEWGPSHYVCPSCGVDTSDPDWRDVLVERVSAKARGEA